MKDQNLIAPTMTAILVGPIQSVTDFVLSEKSTNMLKQPIKKFTSTQDLYEDLRIKFKADASVSFHGSYEMLEDPYVSAKEHVQMVAREIWHVTGYRFT